MSGLGVQRLSGALGAVVDTSAIGDITAVDVVSDLRRLVTDHHVVFLRGRACSEDAFVALAQRFGALSIHPLHELTGRRHTVSVIEDTAERPPAGFPWHTDLSWLTRPPRFGFLQALEIPPAGGDTLWVSLAALYESMSPTFRRLCTTLSAVHRVDATLLATVTANHGAATAAALQAAHPPVTHPLVRAHPDTGAPCLFLSPMYVSEIAGVTAAESALLLDHLDALVTGPERAVRWRWQEGDIAIWDEAATVHRALTDHHPHRRRMRRCTIEGEVPARWEPSWAPTSLERAWC